MSLDVLVTPHIAAARKADLYAQTGLAPEQVFGCYLGTWLACQALLELNIEQNGPDQIQNDAAIDRIFNYAYSAIDNDNVSSLFIGAGTVEAFYGDYGRIVDEHDPRWQQSPSRLLAVVDSLLCQVIERQGV